MSLIECLIGAFYVYLVQSTQQLYEEDDSFFTDRKYVSEKLCNLSEVV